MSTSGWIGATHQLEPPSSSPDRGVVTQAMLGRPILDSFRDRAARSPDAILCLDGDDSLTCQALLARAQRLAAAIAQPDMPPGPVAIMVTGGIRTMVALVAALAAGRPSLVLDPAHPVARNSQVLRQVGAALVIGDGATAADATWPRMLDFAHALDAGTNGDPPPIEPLGLDDAAFIVATSGSSGVPKCIAISQRALLARADGHVNAATYDGHDVAASLSSAAVVGGLYTLIGFPVAGVPVRMIDLGKVGIRALFDLCRQGRITILRGGVSMLRTLATLPDARSALAGLRNVTAYGEALTRADTALLRAALSPACRILHAYGSTEAPASLWYARPDDSHDPVRIPGGYLRPGIEIRITDTDGTPVRRGDVGELWIRGSSVAMGQWRDGRLVTGEPAPDPDHPGWHIHRTGDLARITDDGVLIILGRKDRMVQINGLRVEPAEVEAALRAIPGVADAVVLPRTRGDQAWGDQAWGDQAWLHGFAASRTQAAAAIRAALRQSLPAHMVPARITVVDSIPMMPTGKPDTAALLARAASDGV